MKKPQTKKEILQHLLKTVGHNNRYMCHILGDIGIKCGFLEKSGLKDKWIALGGYIDHAWLIGSIEIPKGERYWDVMITRKRQIIRETLKELENEKEGNNS
jgi:hypothetical protein